MNWFRGWLYALGCVLVLLAPLRGAAALAADQNPPSAPSALAAVAGESVIDYRASNWQSFISLSAGLRRDAIKWSIAGDRYGRNPNIISELEWSGIESQQLRLANRTLWADLFYLRAALGYAWIQEGRIHDSDYAQDDRRGEYSRSISDADGDHFWDAELAMGVPFFMAGRRFMVAPLCGIAVHQQNLRIRNGRQILSSSGNPSLGPISGLNSTYQSRWLGPFAGCDLRYLHIPQGAKQVRMEAAVGVAWHWAAGFRAEADWNLRSDLAHPRSFSQRADGWGIDLTGEWLYHFSPQWSLGLTATCQRWETCSGLHRFYYADGASRAQRFNGIVWTTHSVLISLTYQFP